MQSVSEEPMRPVWFRQIRHLLSGWRGSGERAYEISDVRAPLSKAFLFLVAVGLNGSLVVPSARSSVVVEAAARAMGLASGGAWRARVGTGPTGSAPVGMVQRGAAMRQSGTAEAAEGTGGTSEEACTAPRRGRHAWAGAAVSGRASVDHRCGCEGPPGRPSASRAAVRRTYGTAMSVERECEGVGERVVDTARVFVTVVHVRSLAYASDSVLYGFSATSLTLRPAKP